ncbi:MAG: tRNA (adenosine(37)-N6)-dimethylallyltransferase MiaA [Dethiobacter sp.]|nr:tRNA (adenosine(37)-N6)-dimethylallyltransferase MiaA [Dethiobacter sp.]
MAAKQEDKPPLLALVGPTATGKSDLALVVAQQIKAEIICADSAQIYRRLDIGTAKPTAREQGLAPHHLFDLVDPDCSFSAASYQKAATAAIDAIQQRGRLPILVGGTGLYFQTVTDAYAFGSEGKDQNVRDHLYREAEEKGLQTLYRQLTENDPAAAVKIHPNDRRRIIRALEFITMEGRPISEQVIQTKKNDQPYNLIVFGLSMPRPELYRRIEKRVDQMLQRGFLEEVKALLKAGYAPGCPGLNILGYRQLTAYLSGEMGWEETVEEIKKQTRRLAKRQMTWFRRDPRIIWLEIKDKEELSAPAEIICRQVKEKLAVQANNII